MKAIILAGGLGERLRPLTLTTPKPLLPVHGKPIAQYCIENLLEHRVKNIVLSIGYLAPLIQEYFGDGSRFGAQIQYNIETEKLGTGGAVKEVVDKFGISSDFFLVWGDNLANFDVSSMKGYHDSHEGLITMALTPREDVEHFGVANYEEGVIRGFVEKPKKEEAPSNLINAGAFIINPRALDILSERICSIEKECFEPLSKQNKLYGPEHKGYWFPTDTREKYDFAQQSLG